MLLNAEALTWTPPSDDLPFWTCLDTHGTRWLVKLRGGCRAVRERAFSVIAQALGLSCQSSSYLKMPSHPNPWPFSPARHESSDDCQLAIWFLDEHPHPSLCDNCPVLALNEQFRNRPYDVDVLRRSPVTYALDWARGEMLGMLCEMHEPPGRLFTADHSFVQIDNELMFYRSAGADLRDSPWVVDDGGRMKVAGSGDHATSGNAAARCENDIDTPVAVALRRSVGHEPLVAPPAGLQRDRGHRHVYRRRAPGTHGGCPDHRAHRDGPSVPVQAGGGSRVGHACRRLFRILRAGASKIASEHFSQRDQSRLPLYTMGRSEGSVTPES